MKLQVESGEFLGTDGKRYSHEVTFLAEETWLANGMAEAISEARNDIAEFVGDSNLTVSVIESYRQTEKWYERELTDSDERVRITNNKVRRLQRALKAQSREGEER